jgi:hypothetical protein
VVYVVEPLRLARHSVLPFGPSQVVHVVEPIVVDRHRVPASAMVVEAMSVTSNAMVFMVRSVLL